MKQKLQELQSMVRHGVQELHNKTMFNCKWISPGTFIELLHSYHHIPEKITPKLFNKTMSNAYTQLTNENNSDIIIRRMRSIGGTRVYGYYLKQNEDHNVLYTDHNDWDKKLYTDYIKLLSDCSNDDKSTSGVRTRSRSENSKGIFPAIVSPAHHCL